MRVVRETTFSKCHQIQTTCVPCLTLVCRLHQACLPVKDLDLGYNLVRTHDGKGAFVIVDHDEIDPIASRAPMSTVYASGQNSTAPFFFPIPSLMQLQHALPALMSFTSTYAAWGCYASVPVVMYEVLTCNCCIASVACLCFPSRQSPPGLPGYHVHMLISLQHTKHSNCSIDAWFCPLADLQVGVSVHGPA